MSKYNILRLAMLCTALMAPVTSPAFSLGEIQVHSYFGQPFRATVPIQASTEEEIDSDCMKLSPPPADSDMIYLRRATLSLTRYDGRSQLLITGHFPLEEPYLNVVLDLGCKDRGHLIREYMVLLDPPVYTSQSSNTASDGEIRSTTNVRNSTASEASDIKPLSTTKPPRKRIQQNSKPLKIEANHQDQLKILAGTGEKPAQPGLSEKEHLQQHEKELMKELDDKTAKFLEMQSQLGKLESKLIEMQITLERQNKLLASMQQASAPAQKPAPDRSNNYWLAGSVLLVVSLGYILAHRARKRSLDNWKPTLR